MQKKTIIYRTMYKTGSLCLFILFILVLATLPLSIRQSEGHLVFRPYYLLVIPEFLKGLFTGESLVYFYNDMEWSITEKLPVYFTISLFYLMSSSFIGVLAGFPLGILRYKKRLSASQKMILFINSIPDFFLIIFLQLGVIYISKTSGVRIASIGGVSSYPLLLPLFAMSLYPVLYLIRQISSATFDVTCQDYILYARSKGLSRLAIFKHHIVPALIPQLQGDSTKIILLVLSNMFIAEQLFRINGITRMLMVYGLSGNYQYRYVVHSLFCLFVLYLITRSSLRVVLWLLIKWRGA